MYFIFKVTEITHGPILFNMDICFLCYVEQSAEQSKHKACVVVFTQTYGQMWKHVNHKLYNSGLYYMHRNICVKMSNCENHCLLPAKQAGHI